MQRRSLLTAALLATPLLAPTAVRASEEKKKGGGSHYVPLGSVTGTVIRGDRRRGVLTVEVGLDIPDNGLLALAGASQPRLRAAYVEFVIAYAARLSPGAVPNADYIGGELQRRTDLTLGRPGARLLLGTILVS